MQLWSIIRIKPNSTRLKEIKAPNHYKRFKCQYKEISKLLINKTKQLQVSVGLLTLHKAIQVIVVRLFKILFLVMVIQQLSLQRLKQLI